MTTLTDRLLILISADTKGAVREIDKIGKAAQKLDKDSSKLDRFSRRAGAVGAGLLGASVLAGSAFFKMAQGASDLNEEVSKTGQVFGRSGKDVLDWSDDLASAFGLSKREALAATGAFGNMFRTTGLGERAAAKMSKRMTELAADMASFNNQDPTEMLDRLRSGLAGEAEPLRRFGVLLSEARVKSEAYATGIAEVGAELTEAQKVQARYSLILKDTKLQQGDFARTADGAANKQRIFRAEMQNLTDNVGKAFLPALTKGVSVLGDMAGALNGVDEASGGAVGKVALFTTVASGTVGSMLLVTSGVIKARTAIQDLALQAPRAVGALRGLSLVGGLAFGFYELAEAAGLFDETVTQALGHAEKVSRQSTRSLVRDLVTATKFEIEQGNARARVLRQTNQEERAQAEERASRIRAFRTLTEGSVGSAKRAAAALREQPAVLRELGLSYADLEKVINKEVKAQRQSARDTEAGSRAIDKHTKSTKDNTAAQEENVELLDARRVALIASFDSEIGAAQSAQSLADAIKDGADPLELQASLLSAAGAEAQAAADKYEAMTGKTFTAEEKQNAFRDALIKLKAQFPELGGLVDTYLFKLGSIPPTVSTTIDVYTEGANQELDQLLTRIGNIAALQGAINLNSLLNWGPDRAMGGPVQANRVHLVGEDGPELFVPGSSGTIVPNHKLKNSGGTALMAADSGGSRSYNITVNTMAGGPEVGRQVVRVIQEFERSNGARWRQN